MPCQRSASKIHCAKAVASRLRNNWNTTSFWRAPVATRLFSLKHATHRNPARALSPRTPPRTTSTAAQPASSAPIPVWPSMPSSSRRVSVISPTQLPPIAFQPLMLMVVPTAVNSAVQAAPACQQRVSPAPPPSAASASTSAVMQPQPLQSDRVCLCNETREEIRSHSKAATVVEYSKRAACRGKRYYCAIHLHACLGDLRCISNRTFNPNSWCCPFCRASC